MAGDLADASPTKRWRRAAPHSPTGACCGTIATKAAQYLGGLRDQVSSTAQALQQMVAGLTLHDLDHTEKMKKDLGQLREVANAPEGESGEEHPLQVFG